MFSFPPTIAQVRPPRTKARRLAGIRWPGRIGSVVCVLSALPLTLSAQEHEGDHHFHPNHLAVAVGGMTPLAETSETSWALGADYERRFNPVLGLGLGVDFTFGDHKRAAVLATGVSYRPIGPLRLATGPGVEWVDKEKAGGATSTKAYFLWGFGATYDFHIGDWSLAPTLYLDFVGETKTNLTYMVSLGRGF